SDGQPLVDEVAAKLPNGSLSRVLTPYLSRDGPPGANVTYTSGCLPVDRCCELKKQSLKTPVNSSYTGQSTVYTTSAIGRRQQPHQPAAPEPHQPPPQFSSTSRRQHRFSSTSRRQHRSAVPAAASPGSAVPAKGAFAAANSSSGGSGCGPTAEATDRGLLQSPAPGMDSAGSYQLEFGYFDDYSRKRGPNYSAARRLMLYPLCGLSLLRRPRCCPAASAVGENDSGIEEAPAAVDEAGDKAGPSNRLGGPWFRGHRCSSESRRDFAASDRRLLKSQQRPVPPEQDANWLPQTPALDCMVELLSYYSQAANPGKLTSVSRTLPSGLPTGVGQNPPLCLAVAAELRARSRGGTRRSFPQPPVEQSARTSWPSHWAMAARISNGQANGDKTAQAEAMLR
uniref:TANC2 n=1 Tax=Macrostomum lignano TaxID=282301 RepID=A0A1I8FEK1_9PLAT